MSDSSVQQRIPVQITAVPDKLEENTSLFVLCNDGTIWQSINLNGAYTDEFLWQQLPGVPQN